VSTKNPAAVALGKVGDVVEVLEKDYTPEGDLAGYQAMNDRYDAEVITP